MTYTIDAHVHLGRSYDGEYTIDDGELTRRMDARSIDKAVIFPFTDTPGPSEDAHDKVADAVKEHPDRLIGFARVDPRYGQRAVEELEHAIEDLGLTGLKFHPSSACTSPYHPQSLTVMKKACELKIPVIIHSGDETNALPEHIARLSELLPELTIIMAHMGYVEHANRAIQIARSHANIYLETSIQQSPFRLKIAVQKLGAERLIFGSNMPKGDLEVELVKIECVELNPQQKELVLGGNIARILGIR